MDDSVHQRLSRETDAWTREALRWRHLEVNDSSGTGQAELRLYLVVTPEGANYSGGRVRYALAAATARIKVLADGRCIHSERAKAATRAPRFISASRYRKPRDAPLGFAMQQAIAQALAQLPDSVPGGDARFRAPGPPARDESGAIVPAELELYLEAMIAPFTLDTLARLSSVGYSSWGCGGRPGCASGGSRSSRQVERTLSVYRPNGTTLTVLFIAPDERSPPTDMTVAIDDGWKPGTPVYPPKLGFRLTSPGTDRRSGLLGFTRVEASGDGDTRVWLLRDGAWSEFRP